MYYTKSILSMLLAIVCLGAQAAPYEVSVRPSAPAGGTWTPVQVLEAAVDSVGPEGSHHILSTYLAPFDMAQPTEVRIVCTGKPHSVEVRPAAAGVTTTVKGDTAYITLSRPRYLSIEPNGQRFGNLLLFADTPLTPPAKCDKSTTVFGPGHHRIAGDTLRVASGARIYLAPGADVEGVIWIDGVENVTIYGHGRIKMPGRGAGVEVRNARHVCVDGIITSQCPVGGSEDVEIRNVKVISHYNWGDGLNVFASSRVTYDNCFCRTSDDCTTVYATRKGFSGGCHDITMRHSTLWADVAHPIFIGLHGNAQRPDTIRGVLYEDIDILECAENQLDYQGCLAINAGDNNVVDSVTFRDIRIDHIRRGRLFDLRLPWNRKYCAAPGRCITNVLFENVSYQGTASLSTSLIQGYDDQRTIDRVTFRNLTINGRHIHDAMAGKPRWYKTADFANLFVGEHVDNIHFEP